MTIPITTLNGAQRYIDKLQKNGHGKPAGDKPSERMADQLRVWRAMVDWFAGDHSLKIHSRLIWEPACTLGPLLPQPPAYRPGLDDPIKCQCLSEHWKNRIRLSLAWVIIDQLESGIPKDKLKSRANLELALQFAAELIISNDWQPILEQHFEYYKNNPGLDVQEYWTINAGEYRINIKRYIDGRLTKNINGEELPPEPGSRTPHYFQGWVETEISQAELDELLENCM